MNLDPNSDRDSTNDSPSENQRPPTRDDFYQAELAQYASPQTDSTTKPVLASTTANDESLVRLSWSGYLAWAFVLSITGFMIAIVAIGQFNTTQQVGGNASANDLMQIQLQGKMLVGQEHMFPGQAEAALTPELDSGPYEQRICYSILINEFKGPTDAIEHLEKTDKAAAAANLELTEEQKRLRGLIGKLVKQYEDGDLDSDSLPGPDQLFIEDRLQWIGKLALHPKGTPDTVARTKLEEFGGTMMMTMIGVMILGALMLMVGFLVSILFAILIGTGRLKSNFLNRKYNHNIYIETFAIWMGLFFGSSIFLSIFGGNFIDEKSSLMIQPFIFFGSLVVLCWPIVRGISFKQMREDIGWTAEKPLTNLTASVPAYLAILPYLLPCVIFVVIAMSIVAGFQSAPEFSRQAGPSHPIQEEIMLGGTTTIVLVFLTACVCAPIVEETMFRGVLYRHLRDISGVWRRWISVVFAALLNGLIFASIHPQGMFGIPMLTMLAIGFSLTREWRGSLVSSMVMHFIHNALVTCVMLTIL
ncbi:MAG: lysostaphin resistance A-like protein [Mariniblastus sp.]